MAGVRLLPLVVLLVASCLLSGYTLSKFPHISASVYYLTGAVLVLIGGILLSKRTAHSTHPNQAPRTNTPAPSHS